MRPISRRSRAVTAKKRTKKSAARAELLFCESNLSPFWSFRRRCCHNILGYVHSIPSSFSCRHEKLSGIVLTPIRYAVADPGEGPGGAPRYFSTKMRPKGPKKFSWRPPALISRSSCPPPPPSQGLDPPLICDSLLKRLPWRSFVTFLKLGRNHSSCVWTEALPGMVFAPAQLSYTV